MKRTIFLVLIIFSFTRNSFSQTAGYIITPNNDTLRGETKSTLFKLKFRPSKAIEFKTVNTDTIKEYQLTKDSSVFISEIVPLSPTFSSPQFVQRLEHGKINLYEKVSTAEKLRAWYVNKYADSLTLIKFDDKFTADKVFKKDRQRIFENMLSDDPLIAAELKNGDNFSFDAIRAYVKKYNADADAKR